MFAEVIASRPGRTRTANANPTGSEDRVGLLAHVDEARAWSIEIDDDRQDHRDRRRQHVNRKGCLSSDRPKV